MKSLLKMALRPPYNAVKRIARHLHLKHEVERLSKISNDPCRPKIFYLGITEHSNLGDLAQYYCIRKWLGANYPLHHVHEFEATTVVSTQFDFVGQLRKALNPDDMIFFQSGYTTQDLGGCHELMHRLVIDGCPDAKIVFMPQTVFFQSEERKRQTSKCYNQNKNVIFLARDGVSYDLAREMFPDVAVLQYPDIVTSLIGHCNYKYPREGVLFCCRNDSEKFYSDEELKGLRESVGRLASTDRIDTTIRTDYRIIRANLEQFIRDEVKLFSQYRAVVTDRYHGTIFSLVANTPVIVLKTTDHKVTTGVDWFRGIYDDHVFLATSMDHARDLVESILCRGDTPPLGRYFDREYYGKLRDAIAEKYGNC